MTDIHTQFIDLSELKVGMFVYLDMGWMDHPFPVSSFEVRSQEQITTLQSLGLERIRYAPAKSSPEFSQRHTESAPSLAVISPAQPEPSASELAHSNKLAEGRKRRDLLANQQASLLVCERQFMLASQTFKQVTETVHAQPLLARKHAEDLVHSFLGEVLGEGEAAIRLLSEKAGERTSLHSINVTIISLLLGKALHLDKADMLELGIGALLHDIGKMELPDRLRWPEDHFTHAERQLYQDHVLHGVTIGRKLALSANAMLLIAQHHECVDGSGYPSRILAEKISPLARIAALVNRYDNLCNPGNPALAITPHEALSHIFTQSKSQFHAPTLTAFIRMMGIYPPGSVVQLTDDRFALVVSVNSARPIKPRVVIHNPEIPRDDALVINLDKEKKLGIHRSLKPLQLPKAAYDYLSPRKRLCYFFERGRELEEVGAES
ncbi:putative nucleotidyltransferase with HDIG domain [Undibacterium sp. GrIS 1.2]|uniref:HD-GYP domain-containing protein n=1 Tax=Undibacterium sp. GrIS 1.2 TaxID=3143933 RepID=UPI00339255A6